MFSFPGFAQANCPLDIDLPGMIVKANTQAMAKKRRSLTDSFLSNFETVARFGSFVPALADVVANNRPIRWLGEKTLGISRDRQLPRFQRRTFAKWFRSSAGKNSDRNS